MKLTLRLPAKKNDRANNGDEVVSFYEDMINRRSFCFPFVKFSLTVVHFSLNYPFSLLVRRFLGKIETALRLVKNLLQNKKINKYRACDPWGTRSIVRQILCVFFFSKLFFGNHFLN